MWVPTSYSAQNYPLYTQQYTDLYKKWNKLSDKEKAALPFEVLVEREYGEKTTPTWNKEAGIKIGQNVDMTPDDMMNTLFGQNNISYDSPFGNRWLGPENPLMMKDGDQINFKRDVSPSMMYKYPTDPRKWDKVEWSARSGLGLTGNELRRTNEQTQKMERSEQAEMLAEILRNLFGG